jgi:hypothetical protein
MPIEIRNKIPASSAAARNIPDEIQRESHQFQFIPGRLVEEVSDVGFASCLSFIVYTS